MPRKPKRPCSYPGCPNLTDGRFCEEHESLEQRRYEKACWDYFEGAAFLFSYKGHLVMTDESLYLTEHGDGSHEAPFGAPRGTFDSWDEVEAFLEEVYDELKEDDLL